MKKLIIFLVLSTLFIIAIQFYGKPFLGLTGNTWSVIIGLLGLVFGSSDVISSKNISHTSNGNNCVSIQNVGTINSSVKINRPEEK